MSIEAAIKELDGVCEFLKEHTKINLATYRLTHESLTIIIETSASVPTLKIWLSQITPRLQQIFNRPVSFNLKDVSQPKQSPDQTTNENEFADIQKKLIGKTTYVFSSFDSKYRLLRVEPDKQDTISKEVYYKTNKDISDSEIKNMDHMFHIAAQDHRADKFVKNVIEININNLADPELLSKYAFAFRQIPKPLTSRFILSLVRVPIDSPTEKINSSISTFRGLISPVFLSLGLEHYTNYRMKVTELDVDGLVITVGNPQNKVTIDQIRKSNLNQLNKDVLLLYYTRNWKDIPSLEGHMQAMYMKSKIEN